MRQHFCLAITEIVKKHLGELEQEGVYHTDYHGHRHHPGRHF